MASVNKAIIVGNLGGDPEIRALQSGARVATFSVATSEKWTDKATGEKKEAAEWHRVVVFNDNLVTVAEKFMKKGSRVYVEGAIKERKWQDNAGVDRYSTEIVLSGFNGAIVLLDRAEKGPAPDPESYGTRAAASAGTSGDAASGIDDEVPF